jgi:hypothetical protein
MPPKTTRDSPRSAIWASDGSTSSKVDRPSRATQLPPWVWKCSLRTCVPLSKTLRPWHRPPPSAAESGLRCGASPGVRLRL